MEQMTASVQLITALVGGWNASHLPTPKALVTKTQPTPSPTPWKIQDLAPCFALESIQLAQGAPQATHYPRLS
jgi:hypothetical protein